MTAKIPKPAVSFFPEDTFLSPNVKIDPIEMRNTLIDCTRGIIGIVREGAKRLDILSPSAAGRGYGTG